MTRKPYPWFKFYPADWRGEPSLRAVSMAARGLWIEMLCLMHEAEPRGHLLLSGRPVTDAQLSALAGVPPEIAQALLGELEGAGTFSRTRAGVIYSRKMRRDTALSAKQRANVDKRWQKTPNQNPPEGTDNAKKKIGRNTTPHTKAIPKKPEARGVRTLAPNERESSYSPQPSSRLRDEIALPSGCEIPDQQPAQTDEDRAEIRAGLLELVTDLGKRVA